MVMMTMISAMTIITKYSLPTINFASGYSTRYSDFLLQPYSNPTRSKKSLLVCACSSIITHLSSPIIINQASRINYTSSLITHHHQLLITLKSYLIIHYPPPIKHHPSHINYNSSIIPHYHQSPIIHQ